MNLAAQLADDMAEPIVSVPTTGTKSRLCDLANSVAPIRVASWLGLMLDDEQPRCPNCGSSDSGVALVRGGFKCSHDRCANKGHPRKGGFRTNIDLVMEVRRIGNREAARLLCEHFNIDVSNVNDGLNDDSTEPPERMNGVEELVTVTSSERLPLRLGDLLAPAIERAERRAAGSEMPVPVPFRDYADVLCGGFWPGVHTQVAGTGAGKSTFMFQCATHAARERVPVLYIGLELSAFQVALRALGEAAGVSWSKLYTGRGSSRDIDRAREALPELTQLPFYVEFGTAHGWAPSNLVTRAEQIRKQHPEGPMLVVLDFLQLVGSEPVAFGSAPDLRERIGRASYAGVHVANTFGASVVLISSSARAHYGLLAGDTKGAGITTCNVPGQAGPVRTILSPDALLGLGKESGEIEYAAESQTVLVKWPAPLDTGERVVLAAVPKLRYGAPRWVPFRFWQRFDELPVQTLDELPEAPSRGGKGAPVAGGELEQRVLATVRLHPGLMSKNDIAKNTTGTKQPVLKAIDRLLETGKLTKTDAGFSVVEGANR